MCLWHLKIRVFRWQMEFFFFLFVKEATNSIGFLRSLQWKSVVFGWHVRKRWGLFGENITKSRTAIGSQKGGTWCRLWYVSAYPIPSHHPHKTYNVMIGLSTQITVSLTAHNWQKWKSAFLTCPSHKIYSEEAVGLKSSNYTLKIMIFVNLWNLGQFLENLIFCYMGFFIFVSSCTLERVFSHLEGMC